MEKNVSTRVPASLPMAQTFALEGLLPESTRLVVDPSSHVVLLLALDAGAPVVVLQAVHLTPSAAQLLLALGLASPDYCPYHTLFAALYPLAQWQRDLALRPIRRAIFALSQALRHVGLTVIVLRRRGYVLARASDGPSSEPRERIAARLIEASEQTKPPEEYHG